MSCVATSARASCPATIAISSASSPSLVPESRNCVVTISTLFMYAPWSRSQRVIFGMTPCLPHVFQSGSGWASLLVGMAEGFLMDASSTGSPREKQIRTNTSRAQKCPRKLGIDVCRAIVLLLMVRMESTIVWMNTVKETTPDRADVFGGCCSHQSLEIVSYFFNKINKNSVQVPRRLQWKY